MKMSALLSNINSTLLNNGSKYKVTVDDVDFIVNDIFRIDIPDRDLTIESIEKITSICKKYPEFKAYEHLGNLKVLRLLFDLTTNMKRYDHIKPFENFKHGA